MDPTHTIAEAQVGFEAGTKTALATQEIKFAMSDVGSIPFLLMQGGMSISTIESICPAPMARRGTIIVTSVKSFIELVQREHALMTTVIFANLPSGEAGNITAIIDYHHENGSPAWCEYRITLKLSYTAEWVEWAKVLNKPTMQLDLAEFLEERYIDVHEADGVSGATILETALSLEAKKGVNFKNAVRLQNGDANLIFEETTVAKAGQRGELEIPQKFMLNIPVYEGFEPCPIKVLFRYRIKDGILVFVLKPANIERVIISIREAIIQNISEELELPVYLGDAMTVPTRKLT